MSDPTGGTTPATGPDPKKESDRDAAATTAAGTDSQWGTHDMIRGPCACGAWHDGGDEADARHMIPATVDEFRRQIRTAREIVRLWPQWKREVLGPLGDL